MATDQLLLIQKTNVVLGVVATCVSGLLWGGRGMFAAGVGAAVAVANFWAVRRLALRAAAPVSRGEAAPRPLALVAALVGKMVLLFVLLWLLVRRAGLPVVPFTLGLSVFVLSILLTGLFVGGGESKLPTSSEGQG